MSLIATDPKIRRTPSGRKTADILAGLVSVTDNVEISIKERLPFHVRINGWDRDIES